jgi:DNA modification methylase
MIKTIIPAIWTKKATTEWVDGHLHTLINNYKKNGNSQRISFRELCSNWTWAKRSDVYTHYLHRYPAKLLPYIPIFFLSSSLAANGSILDPFAGTGTVAVEAITHFTNPKDCKLVEISPLARLISAAKTTPIHPSILEKKSVELFSIIEKHRLSNSQIPDFPAIDFWFRKDAQKGLSSIRVAIELLNADFQVKDFFWVCFSSIIRDMSKADPKVSPPVLLSASKFSGKQKEQIQTSINKKDHYKAEVLFSNTVKKNIVRMRKLWEACRISNKQTNVIGHDARSLTRSPYLGKGQLELSSETKLRKNSIGMVITSPPYINAQKYTRATKFELWWLGLLEPNSKALVKYDKSLVGTERILYDEYHEVQVVNNPTADTFIEKIYETDPHKAAVVSKYFKDMRASLKEIKRVLKPGGYCVLVVGNNIVFKQPIPNNQILAEIAQDEGLILDAMLVDEIRSRGLITKRHESAGIIADEWVLLLQKPMI